jgi:y4mF family transcriptional regulator
MSDRTSAATEIGQLGAQLRERRRTLGLTQEEVAVLAETTQRFVSTLETGKSTVRLDKVVDVANVLGLRLCLQDHDDRRIRSVGMQAAL